MTQTTACNETEDVEIECGACGSTALRFFDFDFGTSRETGYSDSGEYYVCIECGNKEQL